MEEIKARNYGTEKAPRNAPLVFVGMTVWSCKYKKTVRISKLPLHQQLTDALHLSLNLSLDFQLGFN